MVLAPALAPVTMPLAEPTVALLLLLLHVPPLTKSLSVIADPTHTAVAPPMLDGVGLTVTTPVA